MARMSIDDRFLRDPRVLRMAVAIGWNKYEARGRLLEVFAIVYDRVNADREPLLTAADIDTAAEWPGLAERLVEFDLAVRTPRGFVRVRGSKEHTNYLDTRKSSGRSGGLKSGETRRQKALEKSKVTFDENEGRSNPSSSDLPSPSALPSAQEERGSPPLALVPPPATEKPSRKQPAKAHPEQQRVIDAFHQRFKAAYATKPTWDGKTVGQVGALLKKHPADTLIARMDFMFAGKAKWPPPPYSLDVFVTNIDRWVDATPAAQVRHIEEL